MTELRQIWSRVPRKLRIALFLLLSCILGFLIYMFLGFPTFTPEQQFRREEQAALVGPSRILGTVQGINGTRIMLGETDYGVLFFTYYPEQPEDGFLTYREKAGDMTLLPAPVTTTFVNKSPILFKNGITADILPLILFDGTPEAVRSELSLCVELPFFQRDFHLEATRQGQDYFAFYLDKNSGSKWQADPLIQFSMQFYDYRSQLVSQPATVRLYDGENNLICTRELTICNRNGTVEDP